MYPGFRSDSARDRSHTDRKTAWSLDAVLSLSRQWSRVTAEIRWAQRAAREVESRYYCSAESLFAAKVCRRPRTGRRPKNCRQRLALRPGGTPQEISRGQVRPSGRGPRLRHRTGHAPAGHRRSFWWRPPHSIPVTPRRLGSFSSMPRWGTESRGPVSGGGVRWGRTCPRLISSGVPPGREPGVPAHSGHAVLRSSEYFAVSFPIQALRLGRSRPALVPALPRCVHPISVGNLRLCLFVVSKFQPLRTG